MASLLDNAIAKQVFKAMRAAKMAQPATLIKVTAGSRTAGALSAGTNPTESSVSCYGFIPTKQTNKVDGMLPERGDRTVSLFGASLGGSVPTTKDKVTIGGETLRIMAVETDAAKAVWTMLCRK